MIDLSTTVIWDLVTNASFGSLVAADAKTNSLIPLYAIGVLTGSTLSQISLVRHWRQQKPPSWWGRAA